MSTNCKFYKEEEYRSIDGGITWTAMGVYRKGDLIEYDSEDCGYVPPTPTGGTKFSASYSGGETYSAACDGNTTLTTATTKPSGYEASAMTEAIVGDCVTSIDDYAFRDFSGLTSVTIPSGITHLGTHSFENCYNLKRINSNVDGVFNIPSGVTSFGGQSWTFGDCKKLVSINIPDGITQLGVGAGGTIARSGIFDGCTSLTSITIPSGVTVIGDCAFNGCTALTSITCLAVTPPSLSSSALKKTTCPIYVPCESVDAYKAAWSAYADRIQCIPTFELYSYIYYREYIHGRLTGTISGTNGFSASFEHTSESATQTLVSNIVGTPQYVGYVMDSSFDTTNPYQAKTKTVYLTHIQEGITYTIRLNVGAGLKGYLKIQKN